MGVVQKYVASRGREVNMTASAYPKYKSGIAKHYDTPILLRACNRRKSSKLQKLVFASIYPAWKKGVVQKYVASKGGELEMTITTYPKNNSGIAKHYDKLRLWRACNTRKIKLPNLHFASIYLALKKGRCPKICGLQRERTEYDSISIPEK